MSALPCEGFVPLPARLEQWQRDLVGRPDVLAEWTAEFGSPINLIEMAAMGRNAEELLGAAAARQVPTRLFFARKANKALGLVDQAGRLGLGVDVASERELLQTLSRGIPPNDIILTAAIKPRPLVEACLEHGVVLAIDNADELALVRSLASARASEAEVALRLAPSAAARPTRFGLTSDEIGQGLSNGTFDGLAIAGTHFHLDGYDAEERAGAIGEAVELVDLVRGQGHPCGFLDIGGGVPMSYLESEASWSAFWAEHERALGGEGPEITFDGHAIGKVYPYWQRPVRGEWLGSILDAPLGSGSVASELKARVLELRLEPGRSLLDGCGMTVARVEFRKRRADGTWLIGLAMNRTQMRSTSDDFMVDPLLARPSGAGDPTDAIEGYLVGAYCIELELLSWRRFRFAHGVSVGDLIAFPNTAGYLMHILESASHQIPLAANLLVSGMSVERDPID